MTVSSSESLDLLLKRVSNVWHWAVSDGETPDVVIY